MAPAAGPLSAADGGFAPARMVADMSDRERPRVPPSLDLAAAIAWRMLVVAAAVVVAAFVLVELRVVLLPVIFALFSSAVLVHPSRWLRRRGFPPAPSAAVVEIAALALIVGLIWLLAPAVGREFADLGPVFRQGLGDVQHWLAAGPLGLSEQQVDAVGERVSEWLRENASSLTTGVVRGATVAVEVIAGAFLFAFLTFFFVKDGERMTGWLVGNVDPPHRELVRALGRRVWAVLGGYLRGTTIVAFVDSTVIGTGLVLIGVPLAAPLTVLVFAGAYFPIVGATLAGAVAALVALVTGGLADALLVVALVVVVQQVEGHVLAPIVLGRAVRLHPAVVLVALTGGAVVAGVAGAFLAVPVTAALAAAGNEIRVRRVLAVPADAEAETGTPPGEPPQGG